MLKHRLSSDDLENDYTLIAIHSNTEPYKLAFEINQKLKKAGFKAYVCVGEYQYESNKDYYKNCTFIQNIFPQVHLKGLKI